MGSAIQAIAELLSKIIDLLSNNPSKRVILLCVIMTITGYNLYITRQALHRLKRDASNMYTNFWKLLTTLRSKLNQCMMESETKESKEIPLKKEPEPPQPSEKALDLIEEMPTLGAVLLRSAENERESEYPLIRQGASSV